MAPSTLEFLGLRVSEKTLDLAEGNSPCLVLEDADGRGHPTYCSGGDSAMGGHAAERPPARNPYHLDMWSRERDENKRLYFIPSAHESPSHTTLDSRKDVHTLLYSTHRSSNDSAPQLLINKILNGTASWGSESSPSAPTMSIPFFYEWAILMLGRCKDVLLHTGIYDGVWASLFQYSCDATVVRAFLELWNPATNTLFMRQGEFSISLWNMYEMYGLPISGEFYDEVSPLLADWTDPRSTPLPESLKFLLLAFHRLQRRLVGKHSSFILTFEVWVSFWFRAGSGVEPVRGTWEEWRRAFGTIGPLRRERTAAEYEVFEELDVPSSLVDEVHLAAFLSLWLCWFVFPAKWYAIRPGVFKVACFIARRVQFGLAGPALANMYRSLNNLCNDPKDLSVPGCMPWHYLYSWLACYFHTHVEDPALIGGRSMIRYGNPLLARSFDEDHARRLFWHGPVKTWYSQSALSSGVLAEVGPRIGKTRNFEYFLSIRSSFLTLREYSFFCVEPYSPHRFARMFGFCQDVPGTLKSDQRIAASLSDLLGLWDAFMKHPCGRVQVPRWLGRREDPGVTSSFLAWWTSQITPFFMVCS